MPPRKSAPAANTARPSGADEQKDDAEDQNIGGGFQSIEEIEDALPYFLKPGNLRDKEMRRPDDPDYD